MLRLGDLEQHYEAAWQEWDASGDQVAWSTTEVDGIGAALQTGIVQRVIGDARAAGRGGDTP